MCRRWSLSGDCSKFWGIFLFFAKLETQANELFGQVMPSWWTLAIQAMTYLGYIGQTGGFIAALAFGYQLSQYCCVKISIAWICCRSPVAGQVVTIVDDLHYVEEAAL